MATIKELDYGLLAELSYINFRDVSLTKGDTQTNSSWKNNARIDIDKSPSANSDRKQPLNDLLNTYEIVDFKSTVSGMQAVLLKDSSGHYTIGYRGTEFGLSWEGFLDTVVADLMGMGLKVIPKFQFIEALGVTTEWMNTYHLNSSNTTLTGHSLGGALAQLNSYTFGFETYTYNAFGFDAATSGFRTTGNAMLSILEDTNYLSNAVKNTSNIHNYFAIGENYQDVVSGGLTEIVDGFNEGHIGEATIIKAYTAGALGSHSIATLNDSIQIYNHIMKAGNISNYNVLTELFDSYKTPRIKESQVIDVVKAIAAILGISTNSTVQTIAQSIGTKSNLNIESYVKESVSQFNSKTKANIYALVHLNHFEITGDFPAYADIDLTNYSEKYLQDRAQYLYYLLDEKHRYDVDPTLSMNHFEDSGLGSDYTLKQSFSRSRILFGGEGYSTLNGGEYGDHLYGMGGNDVLTGNGGIDWLEGGDGTDTLEGGAGNDVLIGGFTKDKVDAFTDHLHGGAGSDTYVSGDGDHIMDSDGEGWVYFEGKLLTGGTKDAGTGCGTQPDGSEVYKGDGGVYRLSGNTLTFTKGGKILTIEDYQKDQLHITLGNGGGGGSCNPGGGSGGEPGGGSGTCPKPINPSFNLNFTLPSIIQKVINYISSSSGGSTYYGGGGGSSGGGNYYSGGGSSSSSPSIPHYTPAPPAPKVVCLNLPYYHCIGIGGSGSSTGPIVLDLNRNGITSISLAASTALFDYDGDGVKENTAWAQATDALLVNDVNNDGIINNATELFGNYTRNSDGSIAKSGYQALNYYDTNSDGVVDATDTRFEELKLWIDANQDGVTDSGELKTLTEMGVTSLTLNSATPYMATTEETNTIIQETTFTDGAGEGVMRDVLFRYENTSTNTEGVYFDMDGKKVNCEARETTLGCGLTDIGELEALGSAGAIQRVYFRDQRKVA